MPDVEWLVDDYGVSHLYAETRPDLWFANGYVHARERLFQMDVLRHVGRGTSAAVSGADQLGLYERFDFKPLALDREAVEAMASDRDTLDVEPTHGRFPRLRAVLGR